MLGEPTLAALAAKLLPEWSSAKVRVRVPRPDGGTHEIAYSVAADLGLEAVDLVLGGETEVVLRARQLLVQQWRTRAALRNRLGALPSGGLGEFLNQARPVTRT